VLSSNENIVSIRFYREKILRSRVHEHSLGDPGMDEKIILEYISVIVGFHCG
jgi:hypothetical protein